MRHDDPEICAEDGSGRGRSVVQVRRGGQHARDRQDAGRDENGLGKAPGLLAARAREDEADEQEVLQAVRERHSAEGGVWRRRQQQGQRVRDGEDEHAGARGRCSSLPGDGDERGADDQPGAAECDVGQGGGRSCVGELGHVRMRDEAENRRGSRGADAPAFGDRQRRPAGGASGERCQAEVLLLVVPQLPAEDTEHGDAEGAGRHERGGGPGGHDEQQRRGDVPARMAAGVPPYVLEREERERGGDVHRRADEQQPGETATGRGDRRDDEAGDCDGDDDPRELSGITHRRSPRPRWCTR